MPIKNPRKPAPRARSSHRAEALPCTFPEAVAAVPVPATTRDRILYAAVFLLNDEGFSALTQARVAECAGVRQSHVTYYFPTRNDLLRETAVYGCNAMLAAMAKGIERGALTLENFRDFLVSTIIDRRFARLMTALVVASDEDPGIKSWLADFEQANRDSIQQGFRQLGMEIATADIELLHAAFVGAVTLDLGESSNASLIRTQRIVRTAFDRIATRPSAPITPRASAQASVGKHRKAET